MGEKIYIGNFAKGLTKNRLPFVIDNDAFPTLFNAYVWRGRVKRKRGTSLLGRLQLVQGTTYSDRPVMGLVDFVSGNSTFPLLLAFDTVKSYMFNQTTSPGFFFNVTYYKVTGNAFNWSGGDYQQFWTTNYQGALWATNGNPGLNLAIGTYISGSGGTTITMNLKVSAVNLTTLVVGDVLFFNEWTSGGSTINGLTGSVSNISGAASGNYVVTFASNQTVAGTGVVLLMTSSIAGQDGIKWFDGDPTSGTGTSPNGLTGWVNFNPPLSLGAFGFDDFSPQIYYLAGATAILPYKDRLLFFGPYIQSKTDASPTQLIDTVIWSWNGTPYFASPTPNAPSGNAYSFDVTAYYVDVTGKGGYLSAGISQKIATVNRNEDVLIVGFTRRQTRFVYTGNDLSPFLFYSINSELGSVSTFSGITLDRGALAIGLYGITLTTQVSCQRIDLEIPDEVFNISDSNNGNLRVNAVRDFYREWIYFSYPYSSSPWKFPTQTFHYNYRDNTWAIFYENYTAHGSFSILTSGLALTWATVGNRYPTWASWNEPWNSSAQTVGFPQVCAGNQQGFVMLLDEGTAEGPSGYISTVTTINPLVLSINSPNHCLMENDYIQLQNMTGAPELNNLIGSVSLIPSGNTFDTDNFLLTFLVDHNYAGGYTSGGVFARLSQPFIQTKQFPIFWEAGRQVRLGVQKYLFDATEDGQVTINIYLSQDPDDAWNSGPIVPDPSSVNNSLIYSDTISTAPEPNNLQTPVSAGQYQIWHRLNTSLIGDTVQIGITLNDLQMRDIVIATSEIALQGIILEVFPGPQLC